MRSQEEVVDIARTAARERGWTWCGRVRARRYRAWLFFGPPRWEIVTNIDCRGCNVCIVIDDASGAVLGASFWPR